MPEGASARPLVDGVLVVDKPAGWTSHDVVARARRLIGTRKVGHAGTLDPMATGLLVLGVGKGTKLLTHLVGCDKAYEATIRLGQSTTSDDAEGEVVAAAGAQGLDPQALSAAVAALTGEIMQRPSSVSAIKVQGRRAYDRVRAGEAVELAPRPVRVTRFEVLGLREALAQEPAAGPGEASVEPLPVTDLEVVVEVSSGTYVRALARDLGVALATGGHLTALRRTRVGGFTIADAHDFCGLDRQAATIAEEHPQDRDAQAVARDLVTPLAEVARRCFPTRELRDDEARSLGYGQQIPSASPGRQGPVAAIAPDGALVALLDESGARARTHVVFTPAGS